MMWTRNLWICPTCTTTHVSNLSKVSRVWVEKVFLLFVCVDLKENGVRGSMYNREFVSSILELVGTNCPEVCLSLYSLCLAPSLVLLHAASCAGPEQ